MHESRGEMEWLFKHNINFEPVSWQYGNMKGLALEDNSEWDPDDENAVCVKHWVEAHGRGIYDFLGFHPFKGSQLR